MPEQTVISYSYNGWTDMPEEEREAIDAFEATRMLSAPPAITRPLLAARTFPLRKAA